MTMSHPAGISGRWLRTISRIRRRIRLRTTAPPSAFLMLKPKRVCGKALARKKTVKWEPERRFPARYTASKSPRRTSRASRGKSRRSESLGRKLMTSLLAARCKDLAAAFGLHANAETVRLGAAAFPRLIGALWQNNPPSNLRAQNRPPAASAAALEPISVFDGRAQGQETMGVAYRAGKSDTPLSCTGLWARYRDSTRPILSPFTNRSAPHPSIDALRKMIIGCCLIGRCLYDLVLSLLRCADCHYVCPRSMRLRNSRRKP